MSTSRGFTLIETIVTIAIAGLIFTLVITNPFANFRNEQVLNGAVEEVLSTLQQARGQTIGSTADSQYGVHLESARIVLFAGASYNQNASTNQFVNLSPLVTLDTISLAGGGSEVIFQRLTGATSQSGSLMIALKSDAAKTRTITINSNGISDVN